MSDLLFKIDIEIDQVQKSFSCKSDQTVLEAAADANVELPSSCLVGMCCTCAAFLKEGSVDMEAMGLKSELQDQGYVLLCQAYPKSDLKIVANQFNAVSRIKILKSPADRRCVFNEYKEWLGESIDDEVLAIPTEIIQNELD